MSAPMPESLPADEADELRRRVQALLALPPSADPESPPHSVREYLRMRMRCGEMQAMINAGMTAAELAVAAADATARYYQ